MSKIPEMIIKDEEIKNIKKQWLEIDRDSQMPFNFDEYGGVDDYKEKLKEGFERLKRGEQPYNFEDSPLYHKWDSVKKRDEGLYKEFKSLFGDLFNSYLEVVK